MSKLKIIKEALEKNKEVIILSKETKSFGEGYSGGLVYNAHIVRYVVAPKTPEYSIDKLNKWFKDLIPNYSALNPIGEEPFAYSNNEKILQTGFLRFDERNLGHTKTLITRIERISDEDFLKNLEGFRDELRVRTEKRDVELGRVIFLTGCPDQKIMERSLKEERYTFHDVEGITK